MRKFIPLFTLSLLGFMGCKAPVLPSGTSYNLTQLFGQTVPEGNGGGIQFDPENMKYMGNTGCNNFSGTYTMEKKKLTLSPAALTKKICPDMKQEDRFLSVLGQVTGFAQKGTELKLMGGDRVLAVFGE